MQQSRPFLQHRLARACACILLCSGALTGGEARAESLEITSFHVWKTPSVVGLSTLELSRDGKQFLAVSDRGWLLRGEMERTEGRLTGIDLKTYVPLLAFDGQPSAARRVGDMSDAEGLAAEEPFKGPFWGSFERWARVEQFETADHAGRALPGHRIFADYPDNRQLEALARHPDGTLYTFVENPLAEGFAVYRFSPGDEGWQIAGHLPDSGWYAVVGADFDGQGRLFVLERRHILARWWQSRIRLVPDITRPGDSRVLWQSGMGGYDNFEGLAVWGTADDLRVTLVSDNNGNTSEVTEFLEFALRDTPPQ